MQDDSIHDEDRYLLFTLAGEYYATPLMGVREVVEYQKPKPIPNTISSFLGVINIRGEIVGVLDLRLRFNFPFPEDKKREAMMVFSSDEGSLAVIADAMEGVVKIRKTDIDRSPKIESRVAQGYLMGIGKLKTKLVTIVDLTRLLSGEEMRTAIDRMNQDA